MNTMFKTLSLAVVGSLVTVAGAQAAGFAGASSDGNNILIKNTNPVSGPHSTNGNEPGIQVTGADGVFAQALLSFKTYQQFAGNDGSIDNYKISTLNASDMPPSHSSLGNFDFAQVPNQDVYFGEWTADRSNPAATHTVYYGGKNKADSLPTSGKVEYSVKGINNFNGNNLLTGTLTADFSTNLLNGRLIRENSTQSNVLKLSNNKINTSQATFSGLASFEQVDLTLPPNTIRSAASTFNYGKSKGAFFGNNGESLAGIATFKNHRELDTAFGGKKIDSSSSAKVSSDVAARQ
ncbi:Slam-dependent surface lipoprotein [Psychrobacter sp. I-STPA10]|uniref:Slam-dependent surface lipoprotein n=1 Tax=Psychrobacter sp. I-STPA10 TaxID=2585769 RepID=UPI001E44313E|nr:Slam-dependent surface lipoprotein [Psychrobacter sp. I-STPA10]